MSKLFEALGVDSHRVSLDGKSIEWVVREEDLKAALERLPVVYRDYCSPRMDEPWTLEDKTATHTARIICIEEIKKEPLKHEFETSAVSNNEFGKLYTNMIPSSFVGKKVKVTVEEVR